MIITARYAAVCPTCAHPIAPGEQVEWEKGRKARHVKCPSGPAPLYSGIGITHAKGRNKKPGSCTGCGAWIAAGEGELYKCVPDGDCVEHFDSDDGGWHVRCLDPEVCKKNRETEKATRRKPWPSWSWRRFGR